MVALHKKCPDGRSDTLPRKVSLLKVNILPLESPISDMRTISESFLGREPSRQECIERICEAFSAIDGGGCSSHTTIYDNGC